LHGGERAIKEIHIRLKEEECNHLKVEALRRGISMGEYIRILLRSDMKDESIRVAAIGRRWLSGLSPQEKHKEIERLKKQDDRLGMLEPYVEAIFNRNPYTGTETICRSIMKKFNIPMTKNIIKMIRRVRARYRKRRQRARGGLKANTTM